jgi:hypothetical protein
MVGAVKLPVAIVATFELAIVVHIVDVSDFLCHEIVPWLLPIKLKVVPVPLHVADEADVTTPTVAGAATLN